MSPHCWECHFTKRHRYDKDHDQNLDDTELSNVLKAAGIAVCVAVRCASVSEPRVDPECRWATRACERAAVRDAETREIAGILRAEQVPTYTDWEFTHANMRWQHFGVWCMVVRE